MKENRTSIRDDRQYKHIRLTLQHANVTSYNFQHDKQIISSVNLVKKSAKIILINENSHGDFFVKQDQMSNLGEQVASMIENNIPHPLEWLDKLIMKICAYAGAVLGLALTALIMYTFLARRENQNFYLTPE